jgi:hypothetical protein
MLPERALRKQEVHHVVLSAAISQSPLDLLDRLAWELDAPREEYEQPEFMRAFDALKAWEGKRRVLGAPDGVLRAIRRLHHKLEEKQGDSPPSVVLLDDPSPEITHTLFGQARDEIWALPIVWMMSGDKARSGDLLKPPADSFFGRVIELPVLGDEQAETLLRRRAGDELDTTTIQRVVQSAQGSPRRLILLASDAVLEAELGTTSTGTSTIAHERRADQILDELGLPSRRLWDALIPMGQASATDETLLKQLGWSRQRASQVFRQLADAGLVEAAQEQVERGRPRTVYRIAGPKLQ